MLVLLGQLGGLLEGSTGLGRLLGPNIREARQPPTAATINTISAIKTIEYLSHSFLSCSRRTSSSTSSNNSDTYANPMPVRVRAPKRSRQESRPPRGGGVP